MQSLKKLHFLQLLFLYIFLPISISQEIPVSYCGSVRIQEPFLNQNPSNSSLLSQMILCKSDKLYFRTSIGLFRISSIDYTAKLVTVSHSSCSLTSNFVSPYHLSAGFPPASSANSLVLLSCSNKGQKMPPFSCNNTSYNGCNVLSSKHDNQEVEKGSFSCLVIDDPVENLGNSFRFKQMNCTHYRRVYRSFEKFEMGTRISFDIPDHVPNPCNQCEKPDGNCGVGLRCICHPMKCKDKVISTGEVLNPCGNLVFSLLFFIVTVEFFLGSLLSR